MNPRVTNPGVTNPGATLPGLIVGLAVGAAAAFGGFGAFVIVLLFGVVGLLVGRYLDGQLDPAALGVTKDRADR